MTDAQRPPIGGVDDLMPQLTPGARALYSRALAEDGLPSGGGTVSGPDEEEGLALLIRLGLLAPDVANPCRLIPVDPQLAAAALRRRARLQAARLEEYSSRVVTELGHLATVYEQARTDQPETPGVQDLVGLEMITSAVDEAMRNCTEEALTAQPGNSRSADSLDRALAKAEALLGRGARLRTLYQHPARFSEPTRDYVAKVTELGAEVRTLDELPKRLMVFDRKVAFLSAAQDSRRAIMVRHPALVAYLADSFERDWRRASPYGARYEEAAGGGTLNAVQESILRMLVEGETDDAIARRLSLNVRTCRAHIAKILKAYDAQSRVQVAYRLGRSEALGWDEGWPIGTTGVTGGAGGNGWQP